jgi:hypothetical protein
VLDKLEFIHACIRDHANPRSVLRDPVGARHDGSHPRSINEESS